MAFKDDYLWGGVFYLYSLLALFCAVLLPANLIAGEIQPALTTDDGTQPVVGISVATLQEQGETGNNFYMNVQTNMLYDLAIIPNAAVEFYLGSGWSIGAEWNFAFWENKSKDWFWQTYGGDLFVRKWLGRQTKAKPLTGHHLGLLGQAITYDFAQGGKRGVQANEDHWNWGASLEYGYSLPVTRRLNIDFDIGVGYVGGKYCDYEDINGEFVWVDTKSRHWIGPTKLAVSLIWQIGCGNYNEGKKSGKKK